MTHDEYQEKVSEYIDGELDDTASVTLFGHLSGCAVCRAFLRGTLELRSRIHDEMLLEERVPATQPPSFVSALVLPLVTLVGILVLFLGISFMAPQIDLQSDLGVGTELNMIQPPDASMIFWGRIP